MKLESASLMQEIVNHLICGNILFQAASCDSILKRFATFFSFL